MKSFTCHLLALLTFCLTAVAANAQCSAPGNSCCGAEGCCESSGCDGDYSCKHGCYNFKCLIPWTCDDLKMEPVEPTKKYCGCYGLFHCPPDDEEEEECKDEDAEKENGDSKEEEEEAKEPEEPDQEQPLMSALHCYCPNTYCKCKNRGFNVYGWLQQGYTANFDSPTDRTNFGVNYNNRSNDWLWNQQYIVMEREIEQNDSVNVGFRLDFYGGHDAPDNTSIQFGWFENVNANPPDTNDFGIDVPQAYAEVHLPILTKNGVDVRVGWYYTNMGWELIPAADTDFYSHMYEFFYAIPFYHSGVQTVIHIGDNVDLMNSVVRGWDAFTADLNDSISYHGYLSWTSCDERASFIAAWITGPELDNNRDNRTQVTCYFDRTFGTCDQWRFVTGGNMAWQENGGDNGQTAEWYGCSAFLFYTIDPRLILGTRCEWFRDDDGFRTGFATSFYEVTMGVTWKAYQNLRIRPEIRFDWANDMQPYNDGMDDSQTTAAFDVIWEF